MLPALLASVVLIVLDAVYPHLPGWSGFLPVLPLALYHLAYLAPRARDLLPAEVDSVYYLGFLVTVGALAAAAFQVAAVQVVDVGPVLQKFAAGLSATAYAIIARLHLQSRARSELPSSPEQALQSYLERSGVLLDSIELAIARVGTLSETATNETAKLAARSQELLEQRAKSTMDALDRSLRTTLEAARESVEETRALLAESRFASERREFGAAVRDGVTVSKELSAALKELRDAAERSGSAFNGTLGALAPLGDSAKSLHMWFDGLTSQEGALTRSAAALESAAVAYRRAAESAERASGGIADVARTAGLSSTALDALSTTARLAGERLDGVSSEWLRLGPAVAQLSNALGATQELSSGLARLSEALPELTPKVSATTQSLVGLRSALASTTESLEADARRSTEAVALLAENLAELAETIVERTRERQGRA